LKKQKKQKNEITPLRAKLRPKCPFFGFAFDPKTRTFQDAHRNKCAALSKGSCQMQSKGQEINWNECQAVDRINPDIFKSGLENTRFFPSEFQPKNTHSEVGFDLSEWFAYTMNSERPVIVRKKKRNMYKRIK